MQIEELTKTQLLLLALLVSFVTSIATGIATASLIDQAPPGVTQTIHKVVERTIETVQPATDPEPSENVTVVTQEKTVVVKDEDLITESIANAENVLVRIIGERQVAVPEEERDRNDPEFVTETATLGLGVVFDAQGTIVTAIPDVVNGVAETYQMTLSDGTELTAQVRARDVARKLVYLVAQVTLEQDISFSPLTFADPAGLRLGQTVIQLSGETGTRAGTGILANITFDTLTLEDPEAAQPVVSLQSSLPAGSAGALLMNIFGEFVGVAQAAGSDVFIPVNVIEAGYEQATAPTDEV